MNPTDSHTRSPRHWLMKSEPQECSIDDALAAPDATVPWTGVRNYQARNFMRDDMQVGDGVLFYHSSCPEPGIAGIARVASTTRADPTQFDPASPYFDPKSPVDAPRWLLLDVQALRKRASSVWPSCAAPRRLHRCACCKRAAGCPSRRWSPMSGLKLRSGWRARGRVCCVGQGQLGHGVHQHL